ncbi:YjiH family protein [Bacillus taeanensis]|uniref:YjiH family protein n=1 Tax=Bacillus taeanensis TaxID=273032 RepID=A0A366XTI0_9BACI|nr:YjiH family protein [Bacillus taeanensis]RBW69207.1 YjiH family protein [Bacillus taeanensis]
MESSKKQIPIQTEKEQQEHSFRDYLTFIIPSLIGIFLFMIPFSYNEEITIPVAMLAGFVESSLANYLPMMMTVIMILTALFSLLAILIKPAFIMKRSFMKTLFNVNTFWLITRIVGALFALLTVFNIGPKWITSEYTGGLLLFDLIPVLFSVFLFAGLFLPLLLNFGLLELFGALLTKIMRPIFTLPGRSSIDCLASWLGDGTVGILLTNKQYEDGFYSKREAAVIGTTFSVVSITFTIVILSYMELQHLFFQYYLTIVIAGLAAAIICPRIPPLSTKPDTFFEKVEAKGDNVVPKGVSPFKWGILKATAEAKRNNDFPALLKSGAKNVLDLWLGVIPVVMAIGTTALIIAEYTPLFKLLGAPFIPLLSIMQVPYAAEAAQTMVVGFADMFLPAVIGSGIESEFTRFVIACVSVTQLIYMSEVGGLLLGSKLPVSFKDLIIIFIERTLITLPIIVLIAHLIF